MRAVIIAAGSSSRFWPLGECHKSLLEIGGKPLIVRTINNLPRQVDEVVVVEPKSKCISKKLKGLKLNREVEFRVQDKPDGMWDAISIGSNDYAGDVLVASGHRFSKFALERLGSGHGTKLLLSKVTNPREYGVVVIENDKAVEIIEKPKKPKSDIIVNSAYRLSPELIRKIVTSPGNDHYMLEKVISSHLGKHPAEFEMIPKEEMPSLKYPWDALRALELVLDEVKSEVHGNVSERAVIEGDVFVDEGASIMPGAYVVGPAYIGRGAFVGTSALVRQSSVEMGAVAGFGSEVTRSLVGPESQIHHSFVGDSVISRNVWLGFGVVTANLRFDKSEIISKVKRTKKNTGRRKFGCAIGCETKVGIGSHIMPGTLIGKKVTVGPGTVVDGNVKDGKKVYVVQKRVIK